MDEKLDPAFGKRLTLFITMRSRGGMIVDADTEEIEEVEIPDKNIGVLELSIEVYDEEAERTIDTINTDYVFKKQPNHKAIILERISYDSSVTIEKDSIFICELPQIEDLITLEMGERPLTDLIKLPDDKILEIEFNWFYDIQQKLVTDVETAKEIIKEILKAKDETGDIGILETFDTPNARAFFINSKKLSENVRERLKLYFMFGKELRKIMVI